MASTELRLAAQQALEALKLIDDAMPFPVAKLAMKNLRAALAEPVQQGCDHCNQPLYAAVKCRVCGRGTKSERNFCPRCGKRTNDIHTCTPPAPLTDEVIAELWHQNGGFHHHFARAIERWLKGNP